MNRFVLCGLTLAAAFLAVACQSATSETKPVETKTWVVNGNDYQFYTNDSAYYGYGFTQWHNNTTDDAQFVTLTGVAKKVSGAANEPFGFIFCRLDNNNYYEFDLTVTGYYSVWEKSSGNWIQLVDWTGSNLIAQGFGVENTVKINRAAGGSFTILINDSTLTSFTDSSVSAPVYGEYVSVGSSSNEAFPGTPVDVRLRITDPVQRPSLPTASVRGLGVEEPHSLFERETRPRD